MIKIKEWIKKNYCWIFGHIWKCINRKQRIAICLRCQRVGWDASASKLFLE